VKTPEGCGSIALENKCDNFMFSHEYPVWGCRCCVSVDDGKAHKLWNVYSVNADLTRVKNDYSNTTKYDVVMDIVDKGKDAIFEEELEDNKIELSEDEKTGIDTAIHKYKNYMQNGYYNTETGDLLMKKFEDNAKQTMDKFLQQTRKQAEKAPVDKAEEATQEEVRQKYYKAKAIYEEIAKKTGVDSPSKTAERKVIKTAEQNQKRAAVTEVIAKCYAPSDIAGAIEAHPELEVVPETVESIKYAQDNEDFGELLNDAKENPQVAADLAKDMLAAKTEEDVAKAIADAHGKARLEKTKTASEKVAIEEETQLAVCRIRTDIAVKKMEVELLDGLEGAADEAEMDAVEKRIREKTDAWKKKVTKEVTEKAEKATSNLAAYAEEVNKKIRSKLAEIKVSGAVRRCKKKAKWGLKKISDRVGKALNKVKNDAETRTALAEAKTKAGTVAKEMKREIAAVVASLKDSGVSDEKKTIFAE
jgi:hypothetical protein